MVERKNILESELILHPDGSIYHLKIKPENLADTVILVGDPQRVEIISGYFDKIEFQGQNREICTHTGYLNNKRLTVMSTGMGTDNIDIVLNELDALVNIDLSSRTIKPQSRSLNIIRLGTSGAIQPDIPLNAFILSEYGLGLDGLLSFYDNNENIIDPALSKAFLDHLNPPADLPTPYIVKASEKLISKIGDGLIRGITATSPGFYGPQGRILRLGLAFPEMISRLQAFKYQGNRIVNFEMETSALYGLGRLLGHNTLTVCVAIANREKHDYNKDYKKAVIKLIESLLEKLVS